MNMSELCLVDIHSIFFLKSIQACHTTTIDTPMLMVNDINKLFKKGDRRVGVRQPTLVIGPIAAMQIFDKIHAAIRQCRKITLERS
ncbi:hypothetical protein WI67_03670 [Burkholderia cepacia]|nr:hypothetical protein WI67_03670 [Burkholderia cepacia]